MAKKRKVVSQTGRDTKAGFVSAELKTPDIPDYVVVELRYESPVAFTRSEVRRAPADAASQADTLNNVLAKYDIQSLRSHFDLPASAVEARIDIADELTGDPEPKKFTKKGMDTEFIESGFVQVIPGDGPENRARAEQEGSGVEGLRGPAARPRGGRDRFAGRQPQLRAVTRLPPRRTERHRRDQNLGTRWRQGLPG